MVVTKLEMRKRPRFRGGRMLKWLVILLLLLALVCTGLSVYVGWSLTHPKRLALTETPAKALLGFSDVSFQSRRDKVELKGWDIPSDKADAPTIIFAHGYGKNRLQNDVPGLEVARFLTQAGFRVLMFDFRNSGVSGGSLTTVGELEEQDLLGAIDWVKANHPGKIGIMGFSMGASTALLAAADEPAVSAVVADSAFNNLKNYLTDNLPVWSHLPNIPFTPLILGIMPVILGVHPGQVDALSAVDRVYPRPVLFIHSVDDRSVPYTNSISLWEKHKDAFEYWQTEKGKHVGSYAVQPKAYADKVIAFFNKLK